MTGAALAGWALAVVAAAVALWGRRSLARHREGVARACHELRGPLTALRLGLAAPDEREPGSWGRAIETELERAALALEDLTEAGRVAAGTSVRSLERVALSGVLADAIMAAQGPARARRVVVEGGWEGPEAIVWGERVRLAQALGNLVANAVEHGGGPVRVRGVARAGQVRVEVADGGAGLPAPLSTLARRPRAGRGTRGRGLAIADAIARRHGGALGTAPAARGAVVVLTLPALGVETARDA